MQPIPVKILNAFSDRFPKVLDKCPECEGLSVCDTSHGSVDCPVCTDKYGNPIVEAKIGVISRDMTGPEQHAFLLFLANVLSREVLEGGSRQ